MGGVDEKTHLLFFHVYASVFLITPDASRHDSSYDGDIEHIGPSGGIPWCQYPDRNDSGVFGIDSIVGGSHLYAIIAWRQLRERNGVIAFISG